MRVTVGKIADGQAGTEQTLVEMFNLIGSGQVDPVVIQVTRDAIGKSSFKREKRLISKAVKGVLRRVQILEDPIRHEFIQSAAITLQTGRGDCDDLVILIGSVLEHMGFEVALVVGSQTPGGEFTHVWLRAWMPRAGQWLPVDPRGMLEFGWPVGRELRDTTRIQEYMFDEESGQLKPGRTGMRGIGRSRRYRRRMGTLVEVQPPAPTFTPVGPVAIEGRIRRARQIKPSVIRDFARISPRRGASVVAGRMRGSGPMTNFRRSVQQRSLRGPQFPFIEEDGPISGEAIAAGGGDVLINAAGTEIEVTTEQKAQKTQRTIQILTIAALATGIFRNVIK